MVRKGGTKETESSAKRIREEATTDAPTGSKTKGCEKMKKYVLQPRAINKQ